MWEKSLKGSLMILDANDWLTDCMDFGEWVSEWGPICSPFANSSTAAFLAFPRRSNGWFLLASFQIEKKNPFLRKKPLEIYREKHAGKKPYQFNVPEYIITYKQRRNAYAIHV